MGQEAGSAAARRWAIDLGLLVAIGLFMGFLGPFGSDRTPQGLRYLYWMVCMVGGGLIGMAGDEWLRSRIATPWRRVLIGSVLMTPAVALLVLTSEHRLLGGPFAWSSYGRLLWQVWPILAAVLGVLALVHHRPSPRVETRTVVAPPLPEAEAAFRRRLSARRRTARLIAVEAHDHYLRVHTDMGEELIALRFADALEELSRAYGWRTHRSWWVAADAVQGVRWRKGGGEVRLIGGLTAPVSRSHAGALKEAGWF